MRVCFPTEKLEGLESRVYGHFGSAKGFVILDTARQSLEEVENSDLHHAHGMCQPLKALGGRAVDAVAVGGIGMGALKKLTQSGVRVYRAVEGSVAENALLLTKGTLPEFRPVDTCAGHGHGETCSHS